MYNRKYKRGVKPIEDRTKIKNTRKTLRFTEAENKRLEAFLEANGKTFTDFVKSRLKDIIWGSNEMK
jgi:hypothetical protein